MHEGRSMDSILHIAFISCTLVVVLGMEKAARKIIYTLFPGYVRDIEETERQVAEYNELSVLALACHNKEAYRGFQELTRDMYWRIFFRKLFLSSSTFFLLLSPYMLLAHYTLSAYMRSPFGLVIVTALVYFMAKTLWMYIKYIVHSKKIASAPHPKNQ